MNSINEFLLVFQEIVSTLWGNRERIKEDNMIPKTKELVWEGKPFAECWVLSAKCWVLKCKPRMSLLVEWLRFWAPNAGDLSLIPGQGTRSHMSQLRVHILQGKILCATTKTQHSQINKLKNNKYFFFFFKKSPPLPHAREGDTF